MISKIIFILFCYSITNVNAETSYKAKFYEAFSSTDTTLINEQLQNLNKSKVIEQKAYIGALLMKKAGIVSSLKEKLNLFLSGRKLLEDAINKGNNNAEYRFLRLVIQENCPSILMYYKNIDADKKIINTNYSNFDIEVKRAVLNYCKESKVLKISNI